MNEYLEDYTSSKPTPIGHVGGIVGIDVENKVVKAIACYDSRELYSELKKIWINDEFIVHPFPVSGYNDP